MSWPFYFVNMNYQFVLASQSPRRRELLKLLQIPFEVLVADADEESVTVEDPAINVVETAVLKANIIAKQISPKKPSIIIAADTTVALSNQMLGKPSSKAEATNMLTALREKPHHVYTGLVLLNTISGQLLKKVNSSMVTMRPYSDAEIEAYVASGDPMDKAGAYAIQHAGFRPVAKLDGCFTGVMGLSICQLIEAFDEWQLPRPKELTAVLKAHQNYPCPLFNQLA